MWTRLQRLCTVKQFPSARQNVMYSKAISAQSAVMVNLNFKTILYANIPINVHRFLGSIVVSIPACHAGDRGSIPRRGV